MWATPKPEDVPRLALNRIVAALDEHIDTTEFRDLPLAYQRLATAEPTGRLARAFGLETTADSLETVERLTPILEVLNARLVLVIEDVERTGDGFDKRHLQRFLWALRKVERASFILAADQDHARLDCDKLCDTIELVPQVEVKHTATIVKVAYDHWRTKFSYIDPHPNRNEGDKLQLEHALLGGTMDYIQRIGRDTPLDALVSLLETPRVIKHVLGRVDQAWRNLYGEVELDDIIIISALRHGAEPVYKFLISNIDAARHKPDAMWPRTTTVRAAWEKEIGSIANGAAAQRLVDLLGIEQLTKDLAVNVTSSPQGVHKNEPTDYFRRIVAEEIGSTEFRDQVVLRDIECWQASRDVALVDKLVAASEGSGQYARMWGHFSGRHSEAELMELTERVVANVLERDGSSAQGDHDAIFQLCHSCNLRLSQNQFAEWLQTLILSAVPVSLPCVNDLYYYWTGKHGIVSDEHRASVRRSIIGVYPGFPTPFWGLSGFFVGDLIGKALWELVENAQRFPRHGGRVLCVHGAVSFHRARPCATRWLPGRGPMRDVELDRCVLGLQSTGEQLCSRQHRRPVHAERSIYPGKTGISGAYAIWETRI